MGYYFVASTRRTRDGKRSPLTRTAAAWDVAIAGHRDDAHNGTRVEGCPACSELERKHAAASAQEGVESDGR